MDISGIELIRRLVSRSRVCPVAPSLAGRCPLSSIVGFCHASLMLRRSPAGQAQNNLSTNVCSAQKPAARRGEAFESGRLPFSESVPPNASPLLLLRASSRISHLRKVDAARLIQQIAIPLDCHDTARIIPQLATMLPTPMRVCSSRVSVLSFQTHSNWHNIPVSLQGGSVLCSLMCS